MRRWLFLVILLVPILLFFRFRETTPGGRESSDLSPDSLRILSLSPNLTEIVFRLGLGGRVVGVTDFCRYPPEAAEKPKVGALLNPNLERMFALEPNLVLMLPAHGGLGEKLSSRGIRSLTVRNDTVEDVLDSIERIGGATGRADRAAALVDSIRGRMEAVRSAPPSIRRRTMIVVSRAGRRIEDVFAVGPGTFLNELLFRAGGRNVFENALARYPEVSVEEILHKNPEVIIELRPDGTDQETERSLARAAWATLPGLKAAEEGRVYVLVGDHLLVPGPRMARIVEELGAALREAG
ncbi:MAG: ABC transporter substrate-binding protein [Candidatus Eisenbacteria bacterium]|nr:ABC transporter substrate-binding protein [Candidatus Eisenbacteria bacterium]